LGTFTYWGWALNLAIVDSGANFVAFAISPAAFEAIASTLPFGSAGFEREPDAKGDRQVRLEPKFVDRLRAMRGPGESYSDVILRLAKAS